MSSNVFKLLVAVGAVVAVVGGIISGPAIDDMLAAQPDLTSTPDPTPQPSPDPGTAPTSTATTVPTKAPVPTVGVLPTSTVVPTATPTPVPETSIRLLPANELSVSASTTLPPETTSTGEVVTYDASNLVDRNINTAWNHDGEIGGFEPIDQVLTIIFDRPQMVREILVDNGYQRPHETIELFEANARVRTFRLVAGGSTSTVSVRDARGSQAIAVDFGGPVTQLTMRIVAIYPGSRWSDLAITELAFIVEE